MGLILGRFRIPTFAPTQNNYPDICPRVWLGLGLGTDVPNPTRDGDIRRKGANVLDAEVLHGLILGRSYPRPDKD